MHGYLTREGVAPLEFLRLAREELRRYKSVRIAKAQVTHARAKGAGFELVLGSGRTVRARKVLLATGVLDDLPPIPGIHRLLGKSAFQCPYCHGWEARGAPVVVVGSAARALEMARALTAWTSDLVVCADSLGPGDKAALRRNRVRIEERPIVRLVAKGEELREAVLEGGRRLPCRFLFFNTPSRQQSDLARRLGCSFTAEGGVRRGKYESTDVPGVYVAGNTIKDVHLVVVAAAEGAKAAMGINKALTKEDFDRRAYC
jgi:thioredoxin reductase